MNVDLDLLCAPEEFRKLKIRLVHQTEIKHCFLAEDGRRELVLWAKGPAHCLSDSVSSLVTLMVTSLALFQVKLTEPMSKSALASIMPTKTRLTSW